MSQQQQQQQHNHQSSILLDTVQVAENLASQNRFADALPLFEAAIGLLAQNNNQHNNKDCPTETRENSVTHEDASSTTTTTIGGMNNNNNNLSPSASTSSSSTYYYQMFQQISLQYAKCLSQLQRFEASLFVIESCYSTNPNDDEHNNNNTNNNCVNIDNNETFLAAAAIVTAGVIETSGAPLRALTDGEGTHEALARKLSPDALHLALECSQALQDWNRVKLYANGLLCINSNSCPALLALGKLASVNGSPNDAASFLVRALKADALCSTALEMIIDNWLLPTCETESLVLSLEFNPSVPTAVAELTRNSYLARIPDASVQLHSDSVNKVPLWLRNYHEALVLLEANDLDGAIRCSTAALSSKGTPIKQFVACLHLSILTQTHETASLFRFAHLLSESFPASAISFYAAGCYYFSIGSFERAGRLFSRATDLDSLFAEAWIAYGHCYARLEEGEQALAAYRRAQNLFPGLRQCDLFLGIQYARQHSAQLALSCLENAQRGRELQQQQQRQQQNNNNNHSSSIGGGLIGPSTSSFDALLLNETGVLYFRSKQHAAALQLFIRAKEALPNKELPADHEVCILFNLASAFRKSKIYDMACRVYLEFIRLRPQAAIGHCGYGFTLHLLGDLDGAIASYRTSLALRRDAFCRDLLERALEERHGRSWFTSSSNNGDDQNNGGGGGGGGGGYDGIEAWLRGGAKNDNSNNNNNNDDGAQHTYNNHHHHHGGGGGGSGGAAVAVAAAAAASSTRVSGLSHIAFDPSLVPPPHASSSSSKHTTTTTSNALGAPPPLPMMVTHQHQDPMGRMTTDNHHQNGGANSSRPSTSPRPTISRALSFQ